jgi:hypothetical protein
MIAAGAAVLAAAVIGVLGWLVHRAVRLERLLVANDRNESDLEALADATREPAWERREACGCFWLAPDAPHADPVWVPCDDHADLLLRAIEAGEDL